jgi:hypothetical protein
VEAEPDDVDQAVVPVARRYADEWTVSLTDVTSLAHEIHALVRDGDTDSAARLLPQESPYPGREELLAHLRG